MTYAIPAIQKISERSIVEHDFWNMSMNGLNANLRLAPRLKGDHTFQLPPGTKIPVFPVGCFPKVPDSWVRDAGSFVCPVDPEWALWFDWTENDSENTAILPSVKGVNPITGRKTEGTALEQYSEKCPVHDVPFGANRLCEKCGYQWPPQSYVSSPNTLWWDGWRQPDGTVRQFFFTAEDEKDIASALIGKQNTMPAFGFAFYELKNRIPRRRDNGRTLYQLGGEWQYDTHFHFYSNQKLGHTVTPDCVPLNSSVDTTYYSAPVHTGQMQNFCDTDMVKCKYEPEEQTSGGILRGSSKDVPKGVVKARRLVETQGLGDLSRSLRKEVSVGAGAKINQNLRPDTRELSDYKDKPSAVIRLYFVFQGQFNDILRGGFKHPSGDAEGFLKGLPKG